MAGMSMSPRAARTRAALLAAGLDLLADRPVDAIAIDEFVAAAGVAKGSFFNHFADKQAFARTLAEGVRRDLEAQVWAANAGLANPLERLAGGMIVSAAYAMREPKRWSVLARAGHGMASALYPLNRGVVKDVSDCVAAGLVRREASRAGFLFWLGCCQTVASAVAETNPSAPEAAEMLRDMLVLSLSGLGAAAADIARLTLLEPLADRLLSTGQPPLGAPAAD